MKFYDKIIFWSGYILFCYPQSHICLSWRKLIIPVYCKIYRSWILTSVLTTTTVCFMVALVRNDGKLCKSTVRRSDRRGSQCKTQWMIDTVSQILWFLRQFLFRCNQYSWVTGRGAGASNVIPRLFDYFSEETAH